MADRLTSLEMVKQWVFSADDQTSTASDVQLGRLIAAASAAVLNYISRPALSRYSGAETRDGGGNGMIVLRRWPVISVESVGIGFVSPVSVPSAAIQVVPISGNSEDDGPSRIILSGYTVPRGPGMVTVSYTSGYVVSEAQAVPAASEYKITTERFWLQDHGVKFASSGADLVLVAGSPTTGQYAVTGGVYTFAAADAGEAVLLSYSWAPDDIVQVVTELVGERFRAKTHIGETSHTVQGQTTVTFTTKDMTDWMKTTLNSYRRVF